MVGGKKKHLPGDGERREGVLDLGATEKRMITEIRKRGWQMIDASDETVVIPAYNHLNYTKMAVESLLKNTPVGYQLILIDNGSVDGTREYFDEVRMRYLKTLGMYYDENRIVEEVGNIAASNATGKYIVCATNDIIFPLRWLKCAVSHFESDPDLGMLGVRANSIGDPVALLPATYKTLDEFHHASFDWSLAHDGERIPVHRVVGMLAVVRAQAFSEVGGFDVNLPTNGKYGGYGFSDDDLSIRMLLAGWKLAIANDIVFHHFGSATVGKTNLGGGMNINQKKYREKLLSNPNIIIRPDGSMTLKISKRGN
jgi:GT2 family glycosyltransferase